MTDESLTSCVHTTWRVPHDVGGTPKWRAFAMSRGTHSHVLGHVEEAKIISTVEEAKIIPTDLATVQHDLGYIYVFFCIMCLICLGLVHASCIMCLHDLGYIYVFFWQRAGVHIYMFGWIYTRYYALSSLWSFAIDRTWSEYIWIKLIIGNKKQQIKAVTLHIIRVGVQPNLVIQLMCTQQSVRR